MTKRRTTRHHRAAGRWQPVLHRAGMVLSSMLLCAVGGAALALVVVPMATDSRPLTVLTASMRPAYPPGTVIVVRPTRADEVRIGDALTYQIRPGEPAVVTHRVVSVGYGADGSRRFVTQGDNNDAPDPDPVRAEQVRGTVWYDVPLVGYASTALTGRRREWVLDAIGVGLLCYAASVFLRRSRRSSPSSRSSTPRGRHVTVP